jgi:uncharacterized protein YprB with RNaseH-like and TPR domain/predicted nuclease with RNAse H fold
VSLIATGEGILPETFIHIDGIGPKTERRLWQQGILDWEALSHTRLARRANIAATLERSRAALASGEVDYFFCALPASERWRAFADFGPRFVALDIETTGLSIYDQVTVIGIESEGHYRTFVRGINLEDAAELLAQAQGLITFNGALFDLPFLRRTFPGLALPRVHVDLRFLARRVGLAGSLKAVEHLSQLDRDHTLADVSGYEATVLWSEYELDGRRRSLRDLVRYNAADTCVLRPLAELVVDRLYERLQLERESPPDDEGRLFDLHALDGLTRRRRAPSPRVPVPRVSASTASLKVGSQALPLSEHRVSEPAVRMGDLLANMSDPAARVVGIDLTGSEVRPSGWALLQGELVLTGTMLSTEEILERTLACAPTLVSIDSPLSLPAGRDCTEDSCDCRSHGITRECERTLKRRGVNVYPCLIQSMQALTRRGMQIAQTLRAAGVAVIESYPGAAQDIMRIPRKRASQTQLRSGLARFGVQGLRPPAALTHDELDAVTSAVVGSFFLADLHEGLGNDREGYLIIPALPESIAPAELRQQCEDGGVGDRGPGLCMVIGPNAETYAQALGSPTATIAHGSQPDSVMVGEDLEDYWSAVAVYGPAVRGALIADPATALKRRPRFLDLQLRADDPQRMRRLRQWSKQWGTPAAVSGD